MRSKIILALYLTVLTTYADDHLPLLNVGSVTFTNVTVTKVTAGDIYFISDAGMGNAKLSKLDPALQKHFHYDAAEAVALEKARAQANAQYQMQLASQPTIHPPDTSREPSRFVRDGLAVGQRFPGFNETAMNGAPLSVAALKGKVVLIDFWATWCGPCRAEMPNVIAAYQKYNSSGFEVVGINLDDDPRAVASFTASQGMTWPQYFDGQSWGSKFVKQYKIQSIPMCYLLDRDGIIVGKGLRGDALDVAVKNALATK